MIWRWPRPHLLAETFSLTSRNFHYFIRFYEFLAVMSDVEDMKGTHCGDEDTGKEPIKPTATPDGDNHRGGAKIPKYSIIPYQKSVPIFGLEPSPGPRGIT